MVKLIEKMTLNWQTSGVKCLHTELKSFLLRRKISDLKVMSGTIQVGSSFFFCTFPFRATLIVKAGRNA